VRGRGSAAREVGSGQRGCAVERVRECLVVRGIHEHARIRSHELRRAADVGRDDRAPRGHSLERREPERLGETRLAENVARGDPRGNGLVTDASDQADSSPPVESIA